MSICSRVGEKLRGSERVSRPTQSPSCLIVHPQRRGQLLDGSNFLGLSLFRQ